MTRDETVNRFLECEAKRAEALAAGKSEGEVHEAAKAHWNAWAKALLAERKAMEADGRWATKKSLFSRLEPKNAETRAWMKTAEADFSRCLFLVRGAEGTSEGGAPPVKSIQLEGDRADFRDFLFPGDASFKSATFTGNASFGGAIFTGQAWFEKAIFTGYASFKRAIFTSSALFMSAAFTGYASFTGAIFTSSALFMNAAFTGNGFFAGARFKQDAGFLLARFDQSATFAGAEFGGRASFEAIRGERGFSMAGAVFDAVPDFIQAHFAEAPRLDNVEVKGRMLTAPEKEPEEGEKLSRREQFHHDWQEKSPLYRRATSGISKDSTLRNVPARWRALKRLAIQGHDTDRELAFFSGEVSSARFAGDWPLPWPIWKASAWGGSLRFYAGWLYQIFSDFGRSLLRPFIAWSLCIVIFAVYFLGQNPDMVAKRREQHRHGFIGQVIAYSNTAWDALFKKPPPACFSKTELDGNQNGFSGLVEQVRAQTNPVNEALSIAYHNALIVLDSSGDSAHRAYGCLYGVERYGGNPVAFVPRSVAIASGIQKLLSAIFIFLFGLALRNMLKVK